MQNILTLIPPVSISLGLSSSLKVVLRVLTIFVLLALLVFSVFQINTYTKEIYLIKNYEKKLNQLTQENKILEINFSEVNSLNNISNYVQNKVFEKTNRVDYIRLLESTVLAK